MELFNQIISLHPDFYQAYSGRCELYLQKGCFDLALDDIDFAIKKTKKDGNYYVQRASVYVAMNKFDKARKDIKRALKLKFDLKMVKRFTKAIGTVFVAVKL